jgi:uncharacterized protein YcgI (DUF1989 family)
MSVAKFGVPFDRERYQNLARETSRRTRVAEGIVPALSGGAFEVRRNQIFRITQVEGPQICDFNAWNRDDPSEFFWSGRTRIIENTHLTVFNRIWSTHPRMRPMATIIADTVDHKPLPGGSRGHDVLFARCTERLWELGGGLPNHRNCQLHLETAIKPYGLGPHHVQDAFNIFQKSGVSPEDGRLYLAPSDAKKGDYIELYAEIDLLVALSACPSGSGSTGLVEGIEVRPLGYEVFSID